MSVSFTTGRALRAVVAVLALCALADTADARAGRGFSIGSRGVKTFTPAPTTRTAPNAAQPIQRSAQGAPQQVNPAASAAPRPAARPVPSSGFGTGFMGGLIGAGVIGYFLGHGFGVSSVLGFLGLVAQFAVIGLAISLLMGAFRKREEVATAGGPAYGGSAPVGNAVKPEAASTATEAIVLEPADYASFERLLSVIQLSYGREDGAALRSATTPEMHGYFTELIESNVRDNVRNEVGPPTLVSGDLAEAWREGTGEYATVAMRFSLTDALLDRATGQILSGNTTTPVEVTEVWTFTRRHGGGANAWRLSAIQQAA